MMKDGKKVLLDFVLTLAVWIVAFAAFFAALCVSCAAVNRALDIEHDAQRQFIQDYKAELKAEQTKD